LAAAMLDGLMVVTRSLLSRLTARMASFSESAM
jgi:hypothetical protein